jgi:error-prone DNA polymerase
MGFYSSSTLVNDARARGLRILPVSVLHSQWRCSVEADDRVRLGLCMVGKLTHSHAQGLLRARQEAPFSSLADFQRRCGLSREELRILATAGALQGLAAHRREALWRVQEPVEEDLFSLAQARLAQKKECCVENPDSENTREAAPICPLPPMNATDRLQADYHATGVSTGPHPMSLLRPHLADAWTAAELGQAPHGSYLAIAGMVICRQRPGTAKGFVFVSLEDETGVSNAIISPALYERNRLLLAEESFLQIEGTLQKNEGVISLKAARLKRLHSAPVHAVASHDFH